MDLRPREERHPRHFSTFVETVCGFPVIQRHHLQPGDIRTCSEDPKGFGDWPYALGRRSYAPPLHVRMYDEAAIHV